MLQTWCSYGRDPVYMSDISLYINRLQLLWEPYHWTSILLFTLWELHWVSSVLNVNVCVPKGEKIIYKHSEWLPVWNLLVFWLTYKSFWSLQYKRREDHRSTTPSDRWAFLWHLSVLPWVWRRLWTLLAPSHPTAWAV